MSQIRFQHVFAGLLLLAAISSFGPSVTATNRARALVQNIFLPVARPARLIGSVLSQRFSHKPLVDEAAPPGQFRGTAEVYAENQSLRLLTASLSAQLNALKVLNADRQSLGDIRPMCTPIAVSGSDTGSRESLTLAGSTLDGLRDGMPVLASGPVLAGRIERAGVGGAQARLITDRGFRVAVRFARYQHNANGTVELVYLGTPQRVVEGVGNGQMAVRDMAQREVKDAGIAEGDWVVLDDPDWPMNLRGLRVGRVTGDVTSRRDAPLFAEIHIQPDNDLMRLREVMVMTRK